MNENQKKEIEETFISRIMNYSDKDIGDFYNKADERYFRLELKRALNKRKGD